VHPKTYEPRALRDDVLATLRQLEPAAESLQSTEALDRLYRVLREGSDAGFLRAEQRASGSAEGMVEAALRRFRG
jgi:carboxylate-amine ligase